MTKFLFLLPYFIAIAISLGVLIYTWRFRNVRGAKAYAWYVTGQCLWGIGYIFELVSQTLDGKIFWDQFQWVAGLFITISFPVFAIQYTETKISQPRLLLLFSFVFPITFLGLIFTDNIHHLLYPEPYLENAFIFNDLKYDFTWVVYAYAVYGYIVTFTGLGIFFQRFIRPHNLYRRQILTVSLGFFIPIFITILTVVGVEFKPFRDVSPFTFALGNLIIAWGLFRYKLFGIVPIARDLIVDNMDDVVVVFDTQNRVVDINRVALETVNKTSEQAIGQPAHVVFADWPELIRQFEHPTTSRTKIAVVTLGKQFHYEVKSTMLYSKQKRYVGRVFVARDITERVNLQISLQKLNEELEERVAKRTEEFHRIVERYRAVVENQHELITCWKPDRIRTFVNEAYCRYYGMTEEEAMDNDFLTLIAPEYRPAIEQKIARLLSGQVDSETEIHQVIRIDGTLGWQEWTDHVIRNKAGEVIEIQSVGRDVTKRMQAAEALRESEEKFRNLFENMNDGFAFHKIILNENGKPIDYQFIDINPVFAKRVGMKPEDLINHTALELFPNTEQAWIDAFGQVAMTGEPMQFTHYSVELNRYYETRLYCPRPEYFAGVFSDVTERELAEQKLAEAYDTTLEGWAKALELRDKETENHSRRVVELTVKLAKAMGVEEEELTHIRRGAILHDIGKMGIPDKILQKPGKLTEDEMEIIRHHPVYSYKLLSGIPFLHKALDIPYCHHEHWDGSGYPRGLVGKEIPLAARIFAVVDVWDAVQSDRPYNSAWSREEAIQLIKDGAGTHFDPQFVDVFLKFIANTKP